jgi:hypothetical protein
LGYITVGRAMEAVTADAVFFIHLVGQGIRYVESRVLFTQG